MTKSYRTWVCFDWSEVTSDDQSKHRYGKLPFGCLGVSTVCGIHVRVHVDVFACNVGVEFDCVSLCEMNRGQR